MAPREREHEAMTESEREVTCTCSDEDRTSLCTPATLEPARPVKSSCLDLCDQNASRQLGTRRARPAKNSLSLGRIGTAADQIVQIQVIAGGQSERMLSSDLSGGGGEDQRHMKRGGSQKGAIGGS